MLVFVAIVMSSIFSFAMGRVAYDPTVKKPLEWHETAKANTLDDVYSVADTRINIEK